MSTELPGKSMALRSAARVAIVAATYNEKYTSALLENCLTELTEADDRVSVDVVRVPGAFEVPMMVKHSIVKASVGRRPDVVIALGVILKGSTAHADLVGTAVTNQLLAISCEEMTPVIHEVLLLDNEQQAFARCIASSLNRGREAARAAMSMLHVLEDAGELQSMMRRASSVSRTASIIMH